MRRKSGHIKAAVDRSSESGKRTYIVTLTAPTSTFEFTDLLAQRKVIGPLDNELKQAVKDTARSYLKSADSLVNRSHKDQAEEPRIKPTMRTMIS
jgi:hypothetical protein